jgi:hypothetical protein
MIDRQVACGLHRKFLIGIFLAPFKRMLVSGEKRTPTNNVTVSAGLLGFASHTTNLGVIARKASPDEAISIFRSEK